MARRISDRSVELDRAGGEIGTGWHAARMAAPRPRPQEASPIGGEILVNSQTAGNQQAPAITALANGGFVVVWEDFSGTLGDNNGASVKAQIFDTAGAKIGTEFLVNTQTARTQGAPTVTGLVNGNFVVTWSDDSRTLGDNSNFSIKAQIFTPARALVGTEFLVNTQITGYQNLSTITGLANGGFVVTWNDSNVALGDGSGDSVKAQIFDAAGAKIGGEFLVNTQTSGHQANAMVTDLANGGFVVTWEDSSGTLGDASSTSVKAQIFDAAGTKVGTEFLVNTETDGGQYELAITGLAGGGFVVTWEDRNDAYDGVADGIDYSGIKAQIFGATGARVGTEFLVSTMTTSDQFYPSISALPGGGFVVTWQDGSDTHPLGDGSGASVRAQVFDAAGVRVGAEFRVNTQTAGDQSTPAVAGLANGDFAITWTDASGTLGDSTGTSIKTQIFSVEGGGGPVDPEPEDPGSEFRVNSQATGNQTDSSVAGLANGGFVVSWTDESALGDGSGSSIKVQRYDAMGAAVGGEVLVNSATAGNQVDSWVAGLANGGFVVTWDDPSTQGAGTGSSIKAQVYDASGATVGGELLVSSQPARETAGPTVTGLVNGNFVVTWWDDSSQTGDGSGLAIRAQLFDATGLKIGTEFAVNTLTDGAQNGPMITALANGGFVATWTDNGGELPAQIFNAAGARVGSVLLADSTAPSNHFHPSITALANGGFVVTWADEDLTGPFTGVFALKAQIFSDTGAKVGGQIIVPVDSAGQADPVITGLANGGFVVAWEDRAPGDGSDYGIRAQMFDANGAKVGGAILINTVTAGHQEFPAIDALANGGFVVTWTDDSHTLGDTSGTSIKAQIFDANGVKVGGTPGGPIVGTPGPDALDGTAGADVIQGLGGNDLLDGKAGADRLEGGTGDDGFVVDQAGDVVIELAGEGNDRVFASASFTLVAGLSVETLSTDWNAGTGAIDLTGNALANLVIGNAGANVLTGGAGNDVLDGKEGNDTLYGGADNDNLYGRDGNDQLFGGAGTNYLAGGTGDDLYFVDNASDQIVELAGQGNDRIYASLSYSLRAGVSVEILSTDFNAGTAAINLTGNELVNTLYGNAGANILSGGGGNDLLEGRDGNDQLHGGAGADMLVGGLGDDLYFIDNAGDTVMEAAGQGSDRIYTSVSYTLAAGVSVDVMSTDWNAGTGALNLTGNELVNTLFGNEGANILNGGGGSDFLEGKGGADTYQFTTALGANNVDIVSGFQTGVDRFALDDAIFTQLNSPGALNLNAFHTGAAAADANDRIVYNSTTGQLYYDADGSGAGAAILFATLQGNPALTASDFMVI